MHVVIPAILQHTGGLLESRHVVANGAFNLHRAADSDPGVDMENLLIDSDWEMRVEVFRVPVAVKS